MKSVFKKAECGGRQGHYTPGDNLGVGQGQEGLAEEMMFKMKSREEGN